MVKELLTKASESLVHPNPVPEKIRNQWLESVQTTKEALKELHNNEIDYIGLN